MKNHLENPDEQASSKQSPGERFAFFCTFGIPSVKTTTKNHPENPDEKASSKHGPGEQYRSGKQTSDKDY